MTEINEAMIFAAGFGKRMLPLSEKIPKPLLSIKKKPLIFYIIEELISLNFKNIVVNCHHLPNQIIDRLKIFSPLVTVTVEKKILDTGGGISRAIKMNYFKNLDQPILLINGDIFWTKAKESPIKNIIKNWNQKKMDLLVSIKKIEDFYGYKGKGDLEVLEKGKKLSKIKFYTGKDFVFTGLQIIKPKLITDIKKEKFSMREVFFSEKKIIYGTVDENEWYHISTPNDLKLINKNFKT